jgi:CheY-like chemotaxis protein
MKTIVVVDDDDLLVESLTDLLEREGYRVVSADNCKDGLARLVSENPDLVLTDFIMPVADGLELVRELRALSEFQSIPVVMMSASHQGSALWTQAKARPLGVSMFLSKPFELEELLAVIEQLIGKGEPRVAKGELGNAENLSPLFHKPAV